MEFLQKIADYFAIFLLLCFIISNFGSIHWFPDLLANFKIQYCISAILLALALLYFHSFLLMFLMCAVCFAAGLQIHKSITPIRTPTSSPPPNFTVMQYNKHYINHPEKRIKNWLEKTDISIDVMTMLEVKDEDITALKNELSSFFPYTYHEKDRPDFLAIFSKHPIENLEVRPICEGICGTRGVKFTVTPEKSKAVTIYTVHTKIPIGYRGHLENFAELEGMADWIKNDLSGNIIFMGDWNTTPFSTAYKQIINTAQLRYESTQPLPITTWPSYGLIPLFQIPIDHILFKGNLSLNSIERGLNFYSDHHSVIANFKVD